MLRQNINKNKNKAERGAKNKTEKIAPIFFLNKKKEEKVKAKARFYRDRSFLRYLAQGIGLHPYLPAVKLSIKI